MSNTARILLVDDEPEIRSFVRQQIEECFAVKVIEAQSGREAISRLQEESFSAIVSDHFMPDGTGLDVFSYLEQHQEIQANFVMFTHDAWITSSETFREKFIAIEKSNTEDLLVALVYMGLPRVGQSS